MQQISHLVRALDKRRGGKPLRTHFLEETERQLALEAGRISLPTLEALLIIYLSQTSFGLDRPANQRLPVAYDMYRRLGVGKRQRRPKPGGNDVGFRRELKGKSIAAWGLFCYDLYVDSILLGINPRILWKRAALI